MKITSCGIIKNEDKPRVGVISINACDDFIHDDIDQGINLSYEEFLLELEERGIEEDSAEWGEECDNFACENETTLVGDWKKVDGKYVPDQNGENGFAATYHDGIITVEWSKTTKKCHHTSPCYMMADGSGPCGDLETEGDSVIAFSLPDDLIRRE
jgi:hypothetical protein